MTQWYKDALNPRVDTVTAVLVGLVLLIQGGAMVAAEVVGAIPIPEQQQSEIEVGLGLIALVIVESLVLVGLWRLWNRIPERIRTAIKYAIALSIAGLTVWLAYTVLGVWGIVLYIVCFGMQEVVLFVWDSGIKWLLFDVVAITIGITITAILGGLLGPIAIIPLLIAALLWDHFAVNLSEIMGDLIDFSASVGIPNYIIIPSQLWIEPGVVGDWITDMTVDERPDGVAGVIGLGDFVIPGMLGVSAWVAGDALLAVGALGGTVAAMVVLRGASEQDGGLPALPWLNTGALVGYGAVYTLVVLGGVVA